MVLSCPKEPFLFVPWQYAIWTNQRTVPIYDHISGDISPKIKNVGTRKVASSIRTASKVSDEGWGQNLHAGGGKECSQLRQPAGSLMRITLRVHVAYAHSLWWARQLFVQIWWDASAHTRDAGSDFRQGGKIAASRTWVPSKFECMGHSCKQTVWGCHPQRAPGLFTFPSSADDVKVLVGIERRCQQELLSLMAKNGNACMTSEYLSPTPGFFAPYLVRNFWPCTQRHWNMNDGRLNGRWSLHSIHVCPFDARFNSA